MQKLDMVKEKLRDMLGNGVCKKEVAKVLGVSLASLYRYLK